MSDAEKNDVANLQLDKLPVYLTAHVEVAHMSPAVLEAHRLSAESSVKVAEAQERAAVVTAESSVRVAKAQENAQVVPAKLLIIRHVVSAVVVAASLLLVFRNPSIGWYVVGIDAILGAIQFTDQALKKFVK
jgi:hypothetical protein